MKELLEMLPKILEHKDELLEQLKPLDPVIDDFIVYMAEKHAVGLRALMDVGFDREEAIQIMCNIKDTMAKRK